MNKKTKLILVAILCVCATGVAVWSLTRTPGAPLDTKVVESMAISPEEKKEADAEAARQAAANAEPTSRKVSGKK